MLSAHRYSTANVLWVSSPPTDWTPSPSPKVTRQILESIAPAMARLVSKVKPFHGGQAATHDFPTAHHLDAFLRRLSSRQGGPVESVLLVLQARGDGRQEGVAPLMAGEALRHLRGGDIAFVCDRDTVVCLLASATQADAASICERLVHLTAQLPVVRLQGLKPRAAVVTTPRDGTNLATLLDAADRSLDRAVA